ncbi:hypothetical protein GCM10007879_21320 [Maritalea porphyrae]|uniref:Uncharacterized protein n=1 Tax=Maritalea porphyrae TaxID=880732 RepID=A0ABQ5URI2_9HYPH|nr:hypothetical protein GCM10007879_21320 [Maritalea porphyrae]
MPPLNALSKCVCHELFDRSHISADVRPQAKAKTSITIEIVVAENNHENALDDLVVVLFI